ncbi:MAG: HAD-IB family hydrolase [Desulfobacterales bacterium]|nr:HAD-IB family hydrolase [Desulfobacterales bacterium]
MDKITEIPTTPRGRRAAFFDVDGTLIQRDSQTLEAHHLLGKGPWHPLYIFRLLKSLVAGYTRLSMTRQNAHYLKTYAGRPRSFLEQEARVLFHRIIQHEFIPACLGRIAHHRRQGDLIVLVSATTEHLIAPIVHHIRPDFYFCTSLAYDASNRCLGQSRGAICADGEKVKIVQKLARSQGLDLTRSHAYSDHDSDIPFLASVGHPRVIRPNRKLKAYARIKGWPCLD